MNTTRKRTYKPGNYKLKVVRVSTGRGVVALETIPKGACVLEYKGRAVSKAEQKADKGKYLFWNTETTMINGNIPRNPAKYINHACKPNCEVDIRSGRIYIFSTKTITPGVELTYDYGPEYFNKHITAQKCLCTSCLVRRSRGG